METTHDFTRPLTAEETRLARMMKAMGNPHRLAILRYLADNPQCITADIVSATPLAQSTVSQHLKVLRDSGLICGTIDGPATNYCLDEDNLAWFRSRVNAYF
jgi:DNA-binding transcriptional ArsR family regulator